MPWMMAMTAIRVAVERMTPSSVSTLRSLLARNESNASRTASSRDTPISSSGYAGGGADVPQFLQPIHQQSIHPEAGPRAGEETEVASVLDRGQTQKRVAREGRMIVDRERDHGIILGLHQQCRNADAFEELIGRLGAVVVVGVSKAENTGGVE